MPIYRGIGGTGTAADVAASDQIAEDSLSASNSATAAATSATAASNSATAASTSETNAAASAAAALVSETNAAASASAASTSEANAAASAASATSSDYAVSTWFTTTNNSANWDTAFGWGDHSLAGYLTSFTETNDLSAAVTWANVPDANITQSSVTQHQTALSITESQISDFGTYEPADATIVKDADIGVTVQAYDADTAKTDVATTWTAAQRGATQTNATTTGSVTLDFSTYQNFVLTMTGNVTLANPSTESVGQSGFIVFIQDGTGSRTVALGTDYETSNGEGVVLSTTASATDVVPYIVIASGRILLGAPQTAFA